SPIPVPTGRSSSSSAPDLVMPSSWTTGRTTSRGRNGSGSRACASPQPRTWPPVSSLGRDSRMPCIIGTSGWQYKHWRDTFYPPDVPGSRWLEYFAARFQTVEVNNTFYRLPQASTFRTWAERTPDDFVVAVKMSRYLTHVKRLKDPEEPVSRFLERARCLGPKLGPVLLQLPPNLEASHDALARTLGLLTPSV